jgi:hypothetical protein
MATLTFTLGFKTDELRNLDLPIEIRKPNSTLIARILASKPFERLRPGRYYASASLPGGQQLVKMFEMSDQDLTIELAPEPEDESMHEWEETAHYLQTPRVTEQEWSGVAFQKGRMAEDFHVTPVVNAQFRLFSGNPVTGPLELKPRWSGLTVGNFEPGRIVQFRVLLQSDPVIVQLIEPGGTVRNMTVPATPFSDALLVFERRTDGTCRMDVHVENTTADMLLRYSSGTATVAAGEASRSVMLDAERLLQDKRQDPIAAAIAATAILRFGQLKWLHEWTANLDAWFTWSPDSASIHGEHLARRGRHPEAAERFFEVPKRGLPLISDALFYAVERLKWYADLKAEHAAGIDQDRARDELAKLLPFAGFVHRQRPLTSYTGIDPRTPTSDSGPVGRTLEAIDLAEWLGDAGPHSNSFGGPTESRSPGNDAAPAVSRKR